jgi:hypothetical protein
MSLVLQSSGGGQITIQEPATASNFTQTLPAADGVTMVSGNMPAFSAYKSGGQTATINTFTKVTFNVEEFDTNNNFASSTFTPTVAGYYQINSIVRFVTTSNLTNVANSIYKNGTEYKRTQINGATFTADFALSNSCVVYLNGSTDTIELYGYISGSGTLSFGDSISATSISGVLVRAA